jgi:hypothetical protein
VGLGHVHQHAVAAEAHHRIALVGLDVDVAGLLAHRLGEQRVDHADDRRVVLGVEEILHRRQLGHQLGEIHLLAHVGDHLGGVVVGAGVGLGEACFEGGTAYAFNLQRQPQAAPHFGHRRQVGPFTHDHLGVLAAQGGHEDAMGLGEGVGQGGGAHGV